MISNLSLRTTVLVVSILISGLLIPYTVFASPIFETDSVKVGTGALEFTFEPEQSWSWPDDDAPFGGKISSTDVAVYAGETLQEVYVLFVEYTANPKKIYLAYSSNVTQHPDSGSFYFANFVNNTSTPKLNEFDPPGGTQFCNTPNIAPNILPQVAVTASHVFVSWLDIIDIVDCGNDADEGYAIATIAIAKSKFDDLTTTAFFVESDTAPAFFNTDNGGATELSPTSYTLTANGTNAFIVWENATDSTVNFIPFNGTKYVAGGDTGVGFGTNIILGTSTSKDPDVIVESTTPYDIHVAWQDEDAGDKDIKLVPITLSGTPKTFNVGTEIDISGTNSVTSANARLAEDGGTVYVSWLEGTSATRQVFVASSASTIPYDPVAVSTNEGTSSDQQIIAGGTNVFVVWEDTIDDSPSASTDILFSNSTSSVDLDFADPVNLSTSTGTSINPKISGNSTHVNVVWNDNTFAPKNLVTKIDGQVWFKSYNVTGNFLGGLQVISEGTTDGTNVYNADGNIGPAPVPNISSTDDIVVAVWSPDPTRTDLLSGFNMWDGSMKTAIPSVVDISFNSTEYLDPRNATLTVVNSTANTSAVAVEVVKVDLFFPQSVVKRNVELLETGINTGIFTKSLNLFNDTNNDLLQGDVFTANYTSGGSTITTQAKIQETRILDFVPINIALHDIGAKVGLRLTDADSNLLPGTAETIKAKIKSDVDNQGIEITLTETGINTGVFEALSSVVFMDDTLTPSVGDSLTLTTTQGAGNDILIETNLQKITTSTTPGGVTLTLTETGLDTDVFTANISICASSDPLCISPNIDGVGGDFITISNTGGLQVSNGIILPDSDVTRGAIEVSCNGSDCGQVRAIYNDLEVPFNVGITTAGGGGGGGVSRAGLVVNALAGLSSVSPSGGGTDGSAPIVSLGNLISNKNFDVPDEIVKIIESSDPTTPLAPIPTSTFADFDLPLTINDNGYPLGDYSNTIQTFSTDIGEPMTITSLYYEQTALQHVSMYMNLRDDTTGDLSRSDTQILYNKDKPIVIIDPNGFFEKVSVNIIEDEETIKKFAEFEIIFAKPMETSDIVFRSWDDRLRSMDTIIFDAIEIIDPQTIVQTIDPEPVEDIIEPVAEVEKVPEGMKNISEWWSQGEVDDTKFKEVIQFLIQEEIIDIPTELNVSVSKDDEFAEEESDVYAEPTIQIPEWIKNNAEWWYLGVISEDDFLKSVEYLVKNEIIQI